MATATDKSRAATRRARSAAKRPEPAPMQFLIFEDNGGFHHWTIVDDRGASLVESGRFDSVDQAEDAAEVVRNGAGSARFERRTSGERPVDLTAHRAAALGDNSDAERWLDEGGSSSSEAVAEWPAPH